MAAPKTVKTYPLAGTNRDFEIPFEYLARKFVIVTLIGTDRKELVLNVDYRFTQRTIITLTRVWGPEEGYNFIEIKRVTSATERLVDFSDGSILRASDLNTATVQALHIAEEGRDIATDTIGVDNNGQLDARGRQIKNLADGVDDGDAISMRQIRAYDTSALNSRNAAKVSETNAKTSETNAASSRTAAAASAAAALVSQNAAKASETASAGSATASAASATNSQKWAAQAEDVVVSNGLYSSFHYSRKSAASAAASAASASTSLTQANRATTEADRAKTEADKLGNANAFMATLDTVSTGIVKWKDAYILQARGFYAYDVNDPSVNVNLLDVNGMYRQGALRFYSSTGQVAIQAAGGQFVAIGKTAAELQSEGNIDINLKGPINATVFRLVSARPIMHFRTPSALHALISTTPSSLQFAVYDSAGANGASILFTNRATAKVDMTIPGNITAETLKPSRVEVAAGGVSTVGGIPVVIAKSSGWVNFVASGSGPQGKNLITHGLGREALGLQLQYRCRVADAGYSPGDILTPVDMNYQSSATTTRGGQLIRVNDNTVDYFCGGTGVVIIHKTSGVATTMTIASWDCRVTAFGIANG